MNCRVCGLVHSAIRSSARVRVDGSHTNLKQHPDTIPSIIVHHTRSTGSDAPPSESHDNPNFTVIHRSHQDDGTSQAVQSSKLDSGYVSYSSTGNVPNDTDNSETIYSIDSLDEELIDIYVKSFSRQLSDDSRKFLGLLNELGECRENSLSNLLKAFAQRLLIESSTRSQREASVFLRKHRMCVYLQFLGI